jgi:hypothetical protein
MGHKQRTKKENYATHNTTTTLHMVAHIDHSHHALGFLSGVLQQHSNHSYAFTHSQNISPHNIPYMVTFGDPQWPSGQTNMQHIAENSLWSCSPLQGTNIVAVILPVAYRNRTATFLRVFASFFFVLCKLPPPFFCQSRHTSIVPPYRRSATGAKSINVVHMYTRMMNAWKESFACTFDKYNYSFLHTSKLPLMYMYV